MRALFFNLLHQLTVSVRFPTLLTKGIAVLLVAPAALRLSLLLYRYDRRIGSQGLQRASARFYKKFYNNLHLVGAPRSSLSSPVRSGGHLYISNHPGIGDTLALLQIIRTERLKILVIAKRFFELMPHLRAHLIPIPADSSQRRGCIREAEQWLASGGDILVYPAGTIEPDPDYSYSTEPVAWSRLPELLVARIHKAGAHCTVHTLRVSSVFHRSYFKHPFVRAAPTPKQRDRRAALCTILFPRVKEGAITIKIYNPIPSRKFNAQCARRIGINASSH